MSLSSARCLIIHDFAQAYNNSRRIESPLFYKRSSGESSLLPSVTELEVTRRGRDLRAVSRPLGVTGVLGLKRHGETKTTSNA